MDFDSAYDTLRERCESLGAEAVLETPTTNRVLTVESAADERIVVRTLEGDESRSLDCERFRSFYEDLVAGSDGLALSNVPPGAEPYAAVLSLLPEVRVESDRLVYDESADTPDTPLLSPGWEERTAPIRLHDDATLLADLLDRVDPDSASVESLVDLYVLLSDVQYEAGDLREDVRDRLLASMDGHKRLHGRFGTVTRTERRRRRLKDEVTVLNRLDERDIPRDWVMSVDRQKLDVVVAVTDLDESDVYDVAEDVYVQKTDVEDLEKEARLRGLAERVETLESDHAERLREEVEDIEERLDALLAD